MADGNTDKLKQLNDGGYNNLIVVALILVAVYLFVRGVSKSRQQAYLNNVANDKPTQQAQALRDAMNRSGIGFMMSFDGTDVDLIMQTAAQIADYGEVSDSYRVLYGSELTNDLASELSRTDLQRFYQIINSRTTTSPTGAGTGPITNVGKTVTATMTSNIRIDKSPYGVESDLFGQNKQAKAGQVLGTYVTEGVLADIPSKGNRNVFVKYEESTWGIKSYHWVLKSAVQIK